MYMGLRDIYPGRIDMIIYRVNQLVGSFPAKFVSSRISQTTFFHMIGNKSFHFIFFEGGGGHFQNWAIPLNLTTTYIIAIFLFSNWI